jgi:hypothetical protein
MVIEPGGAKCGLRNLIGGAAQWLFVVTATLWQHSRVEITRCKRVR